MPRESFSAKAARTREIIAGLKRAYPDAHCELNHSNPLEVTMEEMLVVCKAVRRGVSRALVSCDFPFGPLQEGVESALRAAIRLDKEGGADLVKNANPAL